METPLQTARRLLGALEELAAEEAANLSNLDFVEAVQVIERATPLVVRLAELAEHPEVHSLRPQVQDLLIRRRQNVALLDRHLTGIQSEMRRVDEARGRLARVAPVYAGGAASPSRLNTAA